MDGGGQPELSAPCRPCAATAAAAGLALAPLASDARILSIPACGDTPRHLLVVPADPADPRKDGREALHEIKADPQLRRIPIVVLTTSKAEEDILRSYDLGVSSFIVKPVTFEGLVNLMQTLGRYWFEIVELPPEDEFGG